MNSTVYRFLRLLRVSIMYGKSGTRVMNARALSMMRYQDDINIEHNNEVCRAAVAQRTKRLTRTGQTRVRNWKGANIRLLHSIYKAVIINQRSIRIIYKWTRTAYKYHKRKRFLLNRNEELKFN